MVGGRRVIRGWVAALVVVAAAGATAANGGAGAIKSPDLREWLTYIASDELEGRAVFTTGFGLAAGYIADHLHAWGVKPAGDRGSYLQTVRVLGVKTTSRSTVSVTVNGETRTFADGEGIILPRNMGGKRRFTVDRVEFAGYGLDAPGASHVDFRGKDVQGAAVVWLGTNGPKNIDLSVFRRVLSGRNRYATEQLGAAASIGPMLQAGRTAGAGRGARQTRSARQGRRARQARRSRAARQARPAGSARRARTARPVAFARTGDAVAAPDLRCLRRLQEDART